MHVNIMQATSDDFPHLLFYGPSGAGKKTLIMALLRELYGPGVEKLKIEPRSFKIASKSEPIEINIIASSYHIEMNPSDCGYYDRVVVQEVIKEIAQSQPLETSLTPQRRPYKIVILSEVDKMSKAAQHALRRTMEKYLATCRLIMTATSHARVTPAVLSRSLALRVARPSSSVLSALLSDVCRRENWAQGVALTPLIADKAERNIRRALLMLEVAKMKSGVQLVKTIELPDWEVFVQQLAKEIIDEQSPQK
jgi:replication factor C subunit 3/5